MRLFAAIVPPAEAVLEVTRLLDATSPAAAEPERPRGLFRRRSAVSGAHTAGRPPAVAVANRELDRPTPGEMIIPITGFGHVVQADARRLTAALRKDVATWDVPVVRFSGGKALEFEGDQAVWVSMEGDIDGLRAVARGVPQTVQRLGFFVDRRVFRPWLSLGTITDETTAPYLERLVAALDAFEGRSWGVEHVSLMRRPADAISTEAFEEIERMPLRGSA